MFRRPIRSLVTVALLLAAAGCMSIASKARVTSPGASHAYIVPVEILGTRDRARRNAAALRRERKRLPVTLTAFEDAYYWILPVCNGTVRGDLADSYQYRRGEPIVVECR